MRINNILKTLVTVAVVGVAGASIYNHLKKENKETTKTTKPEKAMTNDTVDVVNNEETTSNIDVTVAEIKNFVTNGLKNRAVVLSVIAGATTVFVVTTAIKRKLNVKREMASYEKLLKALDYYLTNHMASTLDPETYAFYCNDKLPSNLYYACCFAKILENDMLTSEQIKAVADTVGNELTM